MCLNQEQAKAITRLSTREAVGFAPSTAYKQPVHGWIPFVKDPHKSILNEPGDATTSYKIIPWRNLAEIPREAISITQAKPTIPSKPTNKLSIDARLSTDAQRLIFDCIYYPYSAVRARMKRLGISGSVFEAAKRKATEKAYLRASYAGQTLYLIPLNKAFESLGIDNPYKRATSIEHAFYVNLAAYALKQDPRFKTVRLEVPLGKTGSTSDVVTVAHDGTMLAWEVTLSTTNILTNVVKYRGTSFARITFICRSWKLCEAVKRFCAHLELNPDLLSKLSFTYFNQLLKRQRGLYRY